MNKYILLLLLSLIVTILSFIVEYFYPFIKATLSFNDYIKIFLCRYLHFILILYFVLFLLFFKYTGIDTYIYLTVIILLCISWYILECCYLSYYELKFYKLDHSHYDTTFHPTIYSFFRDNSDYIMILIGIIITLNIIYIFIYNNDISMIVKFIYGVIYILLSYDSYSKSRDGTKQKYKFRW